MWFEIQNIPAVAIASQEFVDAAKTQADALGMSDAKCLFVPHPIQDADDAQMAIKADAIVEQLIGCLSEKTK